jgi:hypothetical protein
MEDYIGKLLCKTDEELYDVVIIGGGTAGAVAAIASAMGGAHTLIVERNSYLGGTAAGGQVTPMMHDGMDKRSGYSLVNELIKKRMTEEGYAADDKCGNDGWFNTEMIKFTLEDIFLEYQGELLYQTEFIDAYTENHKIEGIIVHNKSGLRLIRAGIFIDCTGDADVAYASGVPCFTGDELKHNNQAMSLRFMAGNIDIRKLKQYLQQIGENDILEYPLVEIASVWGHESPLNQVFKKGLEDKVLEYDDGKYFQAFAVPGMPGVMSFNCPEIPKLYNALNANSISQALITGRKMIKRLHRFLTLYLPGFEESFLLSVADMPGIRESRRITGKYILSEKDYADRAKFDDAIAGTAYPIDIHGLAEENIPGIRPMERGEYLKYHTGV